MNHDEFQERIGQLMDGELPETEQSGLFAHLSECEECRALYAQLHHMSRAVRTLPETDVPAAMDAKFRVLGMGTPPRSIPVPSLLLSAGAVVMMFLFSYAIGSAQESRMMEQYRGSVPSTVTSANR